MGTCPLSLAELCHPTPSAARLWVLTQCSRPSLRPSEECEEEEEGRKGGGTGSFGGSSDSSPYCFSLSRLLLAPGRNMCLPGRFPALRIAGEGQGASGATVRAPVPPGCMVPRGTDPPGDLKALLGWALPT